MVRSFLAIAKGEEIWRPLKEGPHVYVRIIVRDAVTTLMGQEELRPVPLIASDLEKLHEVQIAFLNMVFGVPLSLFEHIKLCKYAKEI